MKKLILLLAAMLTLTANMAKSDDWDNAKEAWAYGLVTGDFTEALMIIKPLAEQGNAKFQNLMGEMYDIGEGVKQDKMEAMKWFYKAAKQGDVDAQVNLLIKYDYGTSVKQDNLKAHMWFNIARDNGADLPDEVIRGIERRMTPAAINIAQEMTERCLESNYKDC